MLFSLCKLLSETVADHRGFRHYLDILYVRACRFAGVDLSLVKSLSCIKPMRERQWLHSLTASIGVKIPRGVQ